MFGLPQFLQLTVLGSFGGSNLMGRGFIVVSFTQSGKSDFPINDLYTIDIDIKLQNMGIQIGINPNEKNMNELVVKIITSHEEGNSFMNTFKGNAMKTKKINITNMGGIPNAVTIVGKGVAVIVVLPGGLGFIAL